MGDRPKAKARQEARRQEHRGSTLSLSTIHFKTYDCDIAIESNTIMSSETGKSTSTNTSRSNSRLLWTLGISSTRNGRTYDRECRKQEQQQTQSGAVEEEEGEDRPDEDNYEDTVTIQSTDTLYRLVETLCHGPVRDRREHENDCGPDDHMWELRFVPAGMTMDDVDGDPMRDVLLLLQGRNDEEEDADKDNNGDNRRRRQTELCIGPNKQVAESTFQDMGQSDDVRRVDFDTLISDLHVLEVGGTVHLRYDMGSTTELFLRVLSRRKVSAGRGANQSAAMSTEDRAAKDQLDIENVPAYKLSKEQRMDAHFPSFANAFLSNKNMKAVTLGLSRRVTRDDDTTFCSMESASGIDVLYCPLPFADIDAFLTLAEESWSKDHTTEGGGNIRSSYIARYVLPPTSEGREVVAQLREEEENDDGNPWARYGPKNVFFQRDEIETNKDFSFAATFPKTNEQLTNGRFRWIKYQKGVLRVVVGRGTGEDCRDAKKSQTLRLWKKSFESLHDLFCAVEASWCIPGRPSVDLGATVLPRYDNDLGPSKPYPPEPPVLGKKDEARIISAPQKLPRVTALAIAPLRGSDDPVLYSGHEDGTLRRWDMSENKVVWSISAFKNWMPEENYVGFGQSRAGVRGIAVREKAGKHLVYTWAHEIEERTHDERQPAQIRVWRGENGKRHHTLVCQVGSETANPLVSCVVFAPLLYRNNWVDSVIVGLQATASTYKYKSDFIDYDIYDAQELAEGNILPFSYVGNDDDRSFRRMKTWRGHSGFIRAMVSVDNDDCIVSLSEHSGHGFADQIILWSTEEPGIPLSRITLYDSDRRGKISVIKSGIVGMTVNSDVILVGCGFGDIIVPIRVKDGEKLKICGSANLKQRYYDDSSFHGHMVGSGEVTAMVNEGETDIWLFTSGLAESPRLDKNTKRKSLREYEDERRNDDEESVYQALGVRSAAVGKVSFPRRAGGEFNKNESLTSYVAERACGGPEVLALKGRHLVAGFGNGAIVASPLLPNEHPYNTDDTRGYGLKSSCSTETEGCCEFGSLPHLSADDDEDEEEYE